jgi:CRISPR-associated protein Csd2
VTKIEDAEKERTMGRKHIVPYALYKVEGYISAKLANDKTKGTGFSEDDLKLFWDALINMFEHDHSAARGKMAVENLCSNTMTNSAMHLRTNFDMIVEKNESVLPANSLIIL